MSEQVIIQERIDRQTVSPDARQKKNGFVTQEDRTMILEQTLAPEATVAERFVFRPATIEDVEDVLGKR